MRRAVIALVLALPLTLGTAAASAHNGGWGHGPSGPRAAVAGTVVSVNATAGTPLLDRRGQPSVTGAPPAADER